MSRCGSAATRRRASPPSRARTSSRRPTGGSRRSRRRSGRARSSSGPTGGARVFVQDRDTSDVWLLDLADAVPRRVTTGRDPMPFWEDTAPQLSPDGTHVAYAEEGAVKLARADGGPPRTLLAEAGSPLWIDDATLLVSVERADDDSSRLAVTDAHDALAAAARRQPRRTTATSGAPTSRPTAVASRTSSRRATTSSAPRSASPTSRRGAVRALTGTPGMADRGPRWSPDGATIAYVSERSGWWAVHLVGADGAGDRQLTDDAADWSELRWHPDGQRLVGVRGEENAFALATVDVASGAVEQLAPGGCWSAPDWTADGDVLAAFEGRALRRSCGWSRPASAPRSIHAPAPLAVRRAPHIEPERITFPSRDGLGIPAFLYRPADHGAGSPVPVIVHPHGGPTAAHIEDWDGRAAVLPRQGLRLAAGQLPRLDGLRPRLRAAQPRRLGRRGHVGLPRRGRLAARAGVGGRRPAGDRRRLLRLLHGAPVGHRRPAAPLPRRGDGVRRLRHRHVMGAGRPRGRPGPRADDGQARGRRARPTAPARPSTASTSSPCRC